MKKLILTLYLIAVILFVSSYIFRPTTLLWEIGAGILGITIILSIYDVYKNPIYNKQFWVLSLILLSPISIPIYFLRRESLIRMGKKFGTKGYYESNQGNNG